jgi:hypothetical protein
MEGSSRSPIQSTVMTLAWRDWGEGGIKEPLDWNTGGHVLKSQISVKFAG